jgi:steroid 5-alpha reductase family enzyme
MSALFLTLFFLIIVLAFAYLLILKHKNISIIDIFWSLLFLVISIVNFFYFENYSLVKIITMILITLWSLRLSIYLFNRNWGKSEDFRYNQISSRWKKNRNLNILVKVVLLQGLLSFIVSLPIQYIFSSNQILNSNSIFIFIFSIILFLIGFLFESLADYQLMKFKKDKKNTGKLLVSGLWSKSRHPNHFGNFLIWWSFFLISTTQINPLDIWIIISPILMTVLLRYISGVPMLEKKFKNHPDFEKYEKNTPIFFPKLFK